MSNLIRWEPMQEMVTLREAMDRLFDDAFTHPFGRADGLHLPAIDLYQTADDVVVKATIPGIKAEDVQISVTGDLLTIKGEFKERAETNEKTYHLRRQRYGAFERTLSLPARVVADKAKADFEDGILTISLPKAEDVKPKTISVKAK
jgi:HSP20 family protein